jgi:hypothetical protein
MRRGRDSLLLTRSSSSAGRRRLAPLLAGPMVLAALLAGMAPATAASAAPCVSLTTTQPPSPGTEDSELRSVTVLSACNAWAVGSIVQNGPDKALIEHWDGASWTVAQVPPQPLNVDVDLSSVRAVSPANIWAVGRSFGTSGQTLILHWDGTSWTQVLSPSPGDNSALSGLRVVSARDIWAVGNFTTGKDVEHTLIEHWDGASWTVTPTTTLGELFAVAGTSRTSAWAVGQVFTGQRDETLIMRWNGTAWKRVPSPNPGPSGTSLTSVAATSASNAWAVGSAADIDSDPSGGVQTLILRWNGVRWVRVKSPSPGPADSDDGLLGVAATSATDAWAVGALFSANKTLILHWNGKSWTREASPNLGSSDMLESVAASSPAGAWAVGDFRDEHDVGHALALRCC